jgi:hypothetical protein
MHSTTVGVNKSVQEVSQTADTVPEPKTEPEVQSTQLLDARAIEHALLTAHFDKGYYLQQTLDAGAQEDPVSHYMDVGWQQGLDPHPDFSNWFYLDRSPDVRDAGIIPYLHYLQWGRLEGRLPTRNFNNALENSGQLRSDVELVSRNFDIEMYLAADERISRCHLDPVLHFMAFGWKEGRNPSLTFSTSYYLEQNRDVRESGTNPFVHYLIWGKAEGRKALPDEKSLRYSSRIALSTLVIRTHSRITCFMDRLMDQSRSRSILFSTRLKCGPGFCCRKD